MDENYVLPTEVFKAKMLAVRDEMQATKDNVPNPVLINSFDHCRNATKREVYQDIIDTLNEVFDLD